MLKRMLDIHVNDRHLPYLIFFYHESIIDGQDMLWSLGSASEKSMCGAGIEGCTCQNKGP